MVSIFARASSERNWWRLGCVLSLAGLAVALCYLGRRIAPDSGRLYWEYAGRILHAPVTNGYIEWIQHRTGVPPSLTSATRAARSLAPYTDFPSEYPPGSLLFFAAIRYFYDDIAGFSRLFEAVVASLYFLVMVMVLHLVRKSFLAGNNGSLITLYSVLPVIAVSPILIGPFAVARFDMLPTFLAVAGLALFLERRPLPAVFILGLGAATKLWPGIFIPLVAASYWRDGANNSRLLATVASGIAGFLVPHLIMLGIGTRPSDLVNYLRFLGERPPQVESFVANIEVIISYLTHIRIGGGFDFGSQNIYSRYSDYFVKFAAVINIFCLIFAGLYLFKRGRLQHPDDYDITTIFACGFCLCMTILCSRVFSGEYMMWPLPFVLFLFLDKKGLIGVIAFAFSLILLKATYWAYADLNAVQLPGTLISFCKNLMFLIVAGVFGSRMLKFEAKPAKVRA